MGTRSDRFLALPEHAQDVFWQQQATDTEMAHRLAYARYLTAQGCDPDGDAWYEQVTVPLRRCMWLWDEWECPIHTIGKRHPWGPRPFLPAEAAAWRQACRPQVYTAQQQRRQSRRERIEAFKRSNRVEDVIGRATDLRGRGNRLTGCSPLRDERSPSLVVYVDQQSWWDYGAGVGGDVLDWLKLTDPGAYHALVAGE